MDFAQAKKDVLDWIISFVERPHPALDHGTPRSHENLASNLEIRPGTADPYTDLRSIDLGRFEILAFVYDPAEFTAAEFIQQIEDVNAAFLIPRNLLAFAVHPGTYKALDETSIDLARWAIAFVKKNQPCRQSPI